MPPAFSSAPLPVSGGLAPLTYEKKKKNTNNPTGSQALNQSPGGAGVLLGWQQGAKRTPRQAGCSVQAGTAQISLPQPSPACPVPHHMKETLCSSWPCRVPSPPAHPVLHPSSISAPLKAVEVLWFCTDPSNSSSPQSQTMACHAVPNAAQIQHY